MVVVVVANQKKDGTSSRDEQRCSCRRLASLVFVFVLSCFASSCQHFQPKAAMPAFFQFTQGSESRVRPTDSSPLLGRYRAVPPRPGIGPRRPSSPIGLLSNGHDSIHVGYGALIVAEIEAGLLSDGSGEDDRAVGDSKWERLWQSYFIDLFVDPRPSAVKRVVDRWWSRYGLLVFLPAALVRLLYAVILG